MGFLLFISLSPGCQPAGRYPPKPPDKKKDEHAKKTFFDNWAWFKPTPPAFDVPIVFVADSDPEWANLPAFWNHFPRPPAGQPTCHLGQTPLGVSAALVLAGHGQTVKIKVPRGLPDPTPNIPGSNPPTLAKWQLGKSLFYAPILVISKFQKYSCASCHNPNHGFCEDRAGDKLGGKFNTPSLLNCVYNKNQFWDGRVKVLEQVLVRELNDENVAGERRSKEHIWSGLVERLRNDETYLEGFKEVFGGPPTQDNIAKALATYMRTILSGNSPYDRARAAKGKDNDLTAKHFEAALTNADLNSLGQGKKTDAAKSLLQGYKLFQGKARCQLCHSGPLFTDHDFHNIGLEETDFIKQVGRLAQVPVGMKESRLQGAYKTPTLRNLQRTDPYMHNGMFQKLEEVADFFNRKIDADLHEDLAAPLLQAPGQAQRLSLSKEEIADLVLFLRALDGDPVDPVVLAPKK